jgi:hypothetical protein
MQARSKVESFTTILRGARTRPNTSHWRMPDRLTGASACDMRAIMLRAADWSDNDAHTREDDWVGPSLPSLTAVLSLLEPSQAVADPA